MTPLALAVRDLRGRRLLSTALATLAIIGLAGAAPPAAAEWDVRPDVNARLGIQGFVDTDITPELHVSRPLDSYGLSLGVDIGRHFGVDLAGGSLRGGGARPERCERR